MVMGGIVFVMPMCGPGSGAARVMGGITFVVPMSGFGGAAKAEMLVVIPSSRSKAANNWGHGFSRCNFFFISQFES
jgi:hypothetical protein